MSHRPSESVHVCGKFPEVPFGDACGCPPDESVVTCPRCDGSKKEPRPAGWDQNAHLNEGSCGCHDSWDQCPCADDRHSLTCNCCPGGTGLCGPLPCRTCKGLGVVDRG